MVTENRTYLVMACPNRKFMNHSCFGTIFLSFYKKLESMISRRVTKLAIIIILVSVKSYGQEFNVDICVYGGTSAGVIAAYTAQKLGKTAILIEPGKHLGGMTSGGLGFTDIGNKSAITGIARDFYRKIGSHYGKFEQWTFEPHVAEEVFSSYVVAAGFKVLFETRLREVVKDGNTIRGVILEHAKERDKPPIIVHARIFIDCSYEGDLMAGAGVAYRVGREPNSEYTETVNGVQLMEGHQFPDGIDPFRIAAVPSSGLLWGISRDSLPASGTGDHRIQAYNYRICLSAEPGNQVPITRPGGYDSSRYELLIRLLKAQPTKRKLSDFFIWSKMPRHKTDINNRGGFSTDMIGMNYGYPDGSYEEREAIIRSHEAYTKGLLYFFGHDPRVPDRLRDEMLMWGYPKDEYTDNDHWSHQLYIRESRRMVGSYVMTQANCEGKHKVHDGIGMAAYTMDSHNCQRIVVNGNVKNEGNVEVGGFGPYPISYRSITPQEEQAGNLLVPVCLSATHIAYGSIRMEPVFMVLGQSAATAAVIAIDENTEVQQIPVRKLQHQLKINPLADWTAPDIVVDNEEQKHINVSSKKWATMKEGGYGRSFLIIDPTEERKLIQPKELKVESVRFSAGQRQPGAYQLYIYIPKVENATEYMNVKVSDGMKVQERILHTKAIVIEGQTSGDWMSLGQQTIRKGKKPWVEVSTIGATGKVVADAVLWVPVIVGISSLEK
jgi:ribulose 1,5-bisphosphate synthetase/thiazole synthase